MIIINFLKNNWAQLGPILVGLSAIVVYKLQEINKRKNAAALLILQIDELQSRVPEIQSYIINQTTIDFNSFYKSLPLMETNYWNKYKHLFVRNMDNKSYDNFNKFFQYITSIQEQQNLIRNLQKNFIFVKQNNISNIEFQYIIESLKEVEDTKCSIEELQLLLNSIPLASPENNPEKIKQVLYNLLSQNYQSNLQFDMNRFWKIYSTKKQSFSTIVNDNSSLTVYVPVQIPLTLKSILEQYQLLEITGSDGYKKLRKIAKIKN